MLVHCGAKAEQYGTFRLGTIPLSCTGKASNVQFEGPGFCGIFFDNHVFLLFEVTGIVENLVSLINVVFHHAIKDLRSLALDVRGFDLKLSSQQLEEVALNIS